MFIYSTKFNIAISMIEKVAQLLVTLLCLKIMANSLSLEDNGKYAYAASLVVMFGSLTCWAGSELIIPKLSRYKYLRPSIITHGWYLRVFYTTFSFIIGIFIAYFYIQDPKIRFVFLVLMLLPIFVEVGGIFMCWFMVINQYIWISLSRFIGLIIRLVGVYWVAKHKLSFEFFAYAYLFELITFSLLLHFIYFKSKQKMLWQKFDKNIFNKLLYNGVLIGIGLSASFLFLRVDRFFLEKYVPFSEIGIYAVAMQLNDAFILVVQSVLVVLINRLVFAHKNPQKIKQITLFILAISACGIVMCNILSKYVINVLLDDRYGKSADILNIVIYISPFIMLNYLFYNIFLHYKKYVLIGGIWLFGVVSMFIFCNLLIPKFHVYGAIYSIGLSYILMNIIYIYRYFRLHLKQS
ncbi:MAG: hypothetical protein RLZZ210_1612 [Pseudomonadota bacterium]|jgi:O-antigen/teichoic acid export membrane protein